MTEAQLSSERQDQKQDTHMGPSPDFPFLALQVSKHLHVDVTLSGKTSPSF